MSFWEWLNSEPDGGDGDVALWLLLPGYYLFDEAGKRARWPLLYAERDRAAIERDRAAGREPKPVEITSPPRWLTLAVFIGVIIALIWIFMLGIIAGAFNAHADDNFVSPIRECQLPDGDPNGYPCIHTNPVNGKQYIDWSDSHHPDSALPPVDGTYWQLCTRMGDCP